MKISTIKLVFLLIASTSVLFSSAQPIGYYNGTEGKKGEELKQVLHEIINNHVDFSYFQAKNIINYSDADPANPNNVILFYLQESRAASEYGAGGDYINREHVWAKSHGNFADIRPMDGDAFNLRPADASVNMNRSNKDFDNVQPNGTQHTEATECWYSSDAWEPGPKTKGQVARILFYMATRYEGTNGEMDLEVVDKLNTYPLPEHGKLSALLEWNNQYPPSDLERQRNERIFRIQQNRNPFIDNHNLINLIWGDQEPSATEFKNFNQSPDIPFPGDNITISIDVEAAQPPTSVTIYWGNTYNSEQNHMVMTASGTNYSANFNLSGFVSGEYVYYKIATETDTIRATHLLPKTVLTSELTTIPEVKGENTTSPLLNQKVKISGRITGNYDNAFYIQNTSAPRNGVCIYGSLVTGRVGDSIVVSGSVTEYQKLTELDNIDYFYNFKNNQPVEPVTLTISQLNEDYEGVLVKLESVSFRDGGITIGDGNTSLTIEDQTGSGTVFSKIDSKLVGYQLPSDPVNITGVLSQYNNTYQILPRDKSDIEITTGTFDITINKKPLEVYPNPTKGQLFIKTDETLKRVIIYNLAGSVVIRENGNLKKISTQQLESGMYIVEAVSSSNTILRTKFFKN